MYKSDNAHVFKLAILWLHRPLVWNNSMHSQFGNIQHGYRIAAWNCRKGILLQDNTASLKLDEIKYFLIKYDVHIFGLMECDIHGIGSRIKRSNPASTIDILDQLKIDGYDIRLPESWQAHSQARILVYIKQGLKVKWKKLDVIDRDLPSISCEIGTGKERKTSVNFFYREWKSGVSGLDDKASQLD